MASDSQAKDNTNLSANRMRLSDRVKSISKGIRLYFYSEYTEDKGGDVEVSEAVQDGAVVGRHVQKDGKTVETSASADAQMTGDHVKMAQAAGIKKEDIRTTTPSAVASEMNVKGTDLGEGPTELGATSDKQADTPSKPEQTEKANLHPKSEPKSNNNTDKPQEGKKPDNSLFKPKGDKAPGAEGDFKAESAKAPKQTESKSGGPKEGKPDKSMSQMASIKTGPTDSKLEKAVDIKVEPGKITYSQKKPEQQAAPGQPEKPAQNWKKDWESKSPAAKQALRQKLSQDRWMKTPSGTGKVMRKADGDKPSLKAINGLLAAKKAKKAPAPKTRDEKIADALDRQNGKPSKPEGSRMDKIRQSLETISRMKSEMQVNPNAKKRPLKGDGGSVQVNAKGEIVPLGTKEYHPGHEPQSARGDYEAHRDASDNAKTEKAKPILLKDMARYKKFTASGRPFRVMMGTHPDHQSMIGAHHVLSKPMGIKDVDRELKKPTSELSRRVLDAVDGGHDSLYIHQPKSDGKQVGHLKVMKSISEQMERLAKNVLAGYGQGDQTGVPAQAMAMAGEPWQPTPHTSRPEIMNKGPKSHSEHAHAFARGVRQWLANRPARTEQAKTQNDEALLDNPMRHMKKADPKPGAAPEAPKPAGAQTHNPK